MILATRRKPGLYRPRPEETERPAPPTVLVIQPHPWYLARLPIVLRPTHRVFYPDATATRRTGWNLFLAADLDQLVDIEFSANTQDPLGGVVRAPWSTVVEDVAACVQPLSGRAIAAAQRADGTEISHRVYLAEWPGGVRLDTRYRLVFGTRYLRVVTARDVDELGVLITVDCAEVIA